MARCPFATWLPLDFAKDLPEHRPVRLIAHTNGGPGSVGTLGTYFSNQWHQTGRRVGSHFQVDTDGRVGQYIDTARASFTAFAADPGSVSIETQDQGDHLQPWSAAQLAAIIRLARWIRAAHPSIPARLCPRWNGGGVAGHQSFEQWNRNGHDCPGPVRLGQLVQWVIPALAPPFEPAPLLRGGQDMLVMVRPGPAPGPVYVVVAGQLVHITTAWLQTYAAVLGITEAEIRASVLSLSPDAPIFQLPQNA